MSAGPATVGQLETVLAEAAEPGAAGIPAALADALDRLYTMRMIEPQSF